MGNSQDKSKIIELMYLIEENNDDTIIAKVKECVTKYNINIGRTTKKPYSLIEIAFGVDNIELIKLLLTYEPYYIYDCLEYAKSIEATKILLEYAKSKNKIEDIIFNFDVLCDKDIEIFKFVLEFAKSNGLLSLLLTLKDCYHNNILLRAGDIEKIKLLLEYSKLVDNVNKFITHKNMHGQNVLMNNIYNHEIVKFLIENGLKEFVNNVDENGNNSLILCLCNITYIERMYNNHYGRSVSSIDYGSYRYIPKKSINIETLKLLLENGANIYSFSNKFKITPLQHVISTYPENHKIRQLFTKYDTINKINEIKNNPELLKELKNLLVNAE